MISKDCFAALLCAVGFGVFIEVTPTSHAQNAPPSTGLQLWVRADAGVVTNATGLVEKWTDQSSHNNDATQTDDGLKPKLIPDAANGKPTVRFDGSDDYLDVASAAGLDITGDIATFAVIRAQDYANYNSIWGKSQGNLPAPNDWYLIQGNGLPQFYRGDGTGSGIQNAQGERPIKANTYAVIGFRQAGTTATHYLNGSTNGVREVTVTPADTGTNLKIGSRDDLFTKMKGDIAELLIYNVGLSDAEVITAQDYLRNKYGITNTPPTVSITSPANNSTQAAPATITVNVNASDPDGAIAKVTLLANGSTIGTATAAPYKFPLTIGTAGTLTLTAVVTDNRDSTSVTNITVTFTSASTPTLNPNTHLKLWLKGDAGTTTGAGGGVTGWADQSGNNNNAAQADETFAPTVSTLNGKPALHFDGTDDFLDVADSDSLSITGDMAAFYVTQVDDFGGFRAVFAKTSGNQPQPFDYYLSNGSGVPNFLRGNQTDGNNAVQSVGAAGGLAANVPLVAGVQQAGTNVTHYLNGAPFGTGVISLTAQDMDTPLKIGSRDDLGTKMKGNIAEVLIYDAALSSDDLKNVQEYLSAKYGIPQVQLSNSLPKVQITAPTAGTNVPAGTAVTLTATASDTDGSITRVDFFANGIGVASDTTTPYSASYTNNFGGAVTITAVATDNLGKQATSASVNFTVTGGQTAAIPTSGLVLWLKPDQGIIKDAGGAVSEWQDSSGNGNNAAQTDSGKQPAFNATGANGLPTVTFDGTDDYLEVANAPSVAITGDVTSFFVFNVTDYDTYRAIWAKTTGNLPAANDYYLVAVSGLPRFYHGNGTGSGIAEVSGTDAPPTGTFVSAGFELEATTATHFLNGATNGTGNLAATGVDAGGPLQVGTRADLFTKFKGDLAELVIYARALTEAERTQVQDYLQKKYFEAPSNQPTLTVALGNNKTLVFSWPTSAEGFALEASNNLGTGASWAAVTEPVVVLNGQNTVTIQATGSARFFRLKK